MHHHHLHHHVRPLASVQQIINRRHQQQQQQQQQGAMRGSGGPMPYGPAWEANRMRPLQQQQQQQHLLPSMQAFARQHGSNRQRSAVPLTRQSQKLYPRYGLQQPVPVRSRRMRSSISKKKKSKKKPRRTRRPSWNSATALPLSASRFGSHGISLPNPQKKLVRDVWGAPVVLTAASRVGRNPNPQ
jgi:hypothetical protein